MEQQETRLPPQWITDMAPTEVHKFIRDTGQRMTVAETVGNNLTLQVLRHHMYMAWTALCLGATASQSCTA